MQSTKGKLSSSKFKAVFDEHYQWLCDYIFKLSGDFDLTEDIVQEVFIDIWNKRGRVTIHSYRSYLFKACHNRFLEYLRKNKKKMIRTSLDNIKLETLYELQKEEGGFNNERIEKLSRAIEMLPPKCKEAFKLSKFENLKYQEIADIMGISKKTVEIHISKALSRLRSIASTF